MTKTNKRITEKAYRAQTKLKAILFVLTTIKKIDWFPLPVLGYFSKVEVQGSVKKKEKTPSSKY